MNKKGLSLLEIIISTVILSLVMTGLVNVFLAGKKFTQHFRYRMGAGEIGKSFIDPLQSQVTRDTWGTGSNFFSNSSSGSGLAGYSATYSISTHPNDADIKKVKTTISWTE